MNWQALVFDLDDTLYLEHEFVRSGVAAVDRWLWTNRGITGFGPAANQLFSNGIRGRIFNEALDQLGVRATPELVSQLVAVYRAHLPRLTLLSEARWAIDRYRNRFKLGLVTDGYAQTQRNKVAALRLEERFDCLVFTDDFGRENWKPSPVPFHHLMNRLGVAGAECVYVADNPAKDFIAPNALGWMTVQISREGSEYSRAGLEILPPAQAAKTNIASLRELEALLD
jgi:putative hydrolase of the HAD superfamily